MYTIIGLGNPGLKYKKTRHNAGFMALDILQKENGFPRFKMDKKLSSEVSKGVIEGQEVTLAKPQTFMNSSGLAVKQLSKESKELNSFDNLIIIHDEVDLPVGEIKISKDISSAHNGVKSIVQAIDTSDFIRIRIGIKPNHPINDLKKFVLQKFSREEKKLLEASLTKASGAIQTIISQGLDKAMSQYN